MRAIIHNTTTNFRIHYKETGVVWKLSNVFLQSIPFQYENIVFLCIGTDRSTGDALGPLTGSHLSELKTFPFPVIGTLETPLHALNLEQQIEELQNNNPEAFIVAIDACLGKGTSIGQFLFQHEPLKPGQAVGKTLPLVGDVSIKGVVNVAGFMEHSVLQSTRLHLPYEMSRILSRALQLAYSRYQSKKIYNGNNHTYYQDTGN
ncbi:spore protease YyaC [Sporosarcina pasteurii]|uniref:Putative sporulation protein YyaC n=1 Tax=Sporosarcina pasteurii TaxID=1474 RepID=A0A380CLN8_SPOPA|nr:spore protease YyaC [Sporosarcina pasteurii]MDS9471841.1 spore protease YyaC [Sporosarcina pasteurii]QBQ06580.1 spore protease YyaC [Sporosarcina pasteurii]SUJ22023.1 putative sporulation protein YyaC [Sporosarcina pasteurii]